MLSFDPSYAVLSMPQYLNSFCYFYDDIRGLEL